VQRLRPPVRSLLPCRTPGGHQVTARHWCHSPLRVPRTPSLPPLLRDHHASLGYKNQVSPFGPVIFRPPWGAPSAALFFPMPGNTGELCFLLPFIPFGLSSAELDTSTATPCRSRRLRRPECPEPPSLLPLNPPPLPTDFDEPCAPNTLLGYIPAAPRSWRRRPRHPGGRRRARPAAPPRGGSARSPALGAPTWCCGHGLAG
jgi:hypothetical protein